jgi:Di-haem oxidoreductase, putative peroxidase
MRNSMAGAALALALGGCVGGGSDGDPVALSATIPQSMIDRGAFSAEILFDTGLVLFTHDFTCAEGGGTGGPGQCLHDRLHGPETDSCLDCHNVPLRDGGGALSTNVFRGGDTIATSTQRNPPHLFGAGYVEALALEINAALAAERAAAVAQAASTHADVTAALTAKGIGFGQLVAHASGAVDVAPDGIDADLIAKPFMAKGFVPTIRAQNLGAFPGHLGIQPTESVGVGVDGDGDGVVNELDPGRLSAVVAYQVLLAAPSFVAAADDAPDGVALFQKIGCAACHVPLVRLENPSYLLADPADPTIGATLDLGDPTDSPRLARVSDRGPVLVPLFSDFKRHDLGPQLADPIDSNGVSAELFLTTRLWGVGSTAPYLHDGRASTLDEAIRWHGGEAQAAHDVYVALGPSDQGALLDFLSSLVLQRNAGTAPLPPGVVDTGY